MGVSSDRVRSTDIINDRSIQDLHTIITYYSFKHGLEIIIDHNDIGVSSRMGVIPPSLEVCVKSDFK